MGSDLLEVVVAKTLEGLREFPGVWIATSIGLGTYPKIDRHSYCQSMDLLG